VVRRVAFAAISTSTVVACSLFVDLDGLTGPAAGADSGLASADASDAQASDGDTTPDATLPDGAPPIRFCAGTTHAFCADFDDGDPFAAWQKSTDPLGQLEISQTHARSLPRALFASIARRAADEPKIPVLLNKRFEGSWRRIVVELDMYLERPDWKDGDINAALFSIELYSDTKNDGFYIASGLDYTNFNDAFGTPMPKDQWVHLKVDFDPAGTATAQLGAVGYVLHFAPYGPGPAQTMNVRIGINGYNVPAPRFAAYYDNVTIDLP
jgi:hypothetical protein